MTKANFPCAQQLSNESLSPPSFEKMRRTCVQYREGGKMGIEITKIIVQIIGKPETRITLPESQDFK
jgi:hypothetical protein